MTESRDSLWQRVYEVAAGDYTTIPGYELQDAQLTADAAADGWYSKSGWMGPYRRRTVRGLASCPRPGNLLNLTPNGGSFLSVEYVSPEGMISIEGFDAGDRIPLCWSHDLQALFIFPYVPASKCHFPAPKREAELMKVWAEGRAATCSSMQVWPAPPLPLAAPGICISYRSDKFKKNGRHTEIDYIHHFGPGVVVYRSKPPRGGKAPEVIMVRGGELKLTKHGIDG